MSGVREGPPSNDFALGSCPSPTGASRWGLSSGASDESVRRREELNGHRRGDPTLPLRCCAAQAQAQTCILLCLIQACISPVRRPADWRMFQKRNGTLCIPVEEHRPKVSGSPRVPARHLGPLRSLDTISRTHCCIRMDGCVPVSPSGLFDRRCNSSIDQLPRSRHDSRRRTVPCDGVVHAVQCHPAATMSPAFLSAASDATATPSQRFHVGPALALAPGPCHPHLTKAPQIAHAMYTRRTYLQVHDSLVWLVHCAAVPSRATWLSWLVQCCGAVKPPAC